MTFDKFLRGLKLVADPTPSGFVTRWQFCKKHLLKEKFLVPFISGLIMAQILHAYEVF